LGESEERAAQQQKIGRKAIHGSWTGEEVGRERHKKRGKPRRKIHSGGSRDKEQLYLLWTKKRVCNYGVAAILAISGKRGEIRRVVRTLKTDIWGGGGKKGKKERHPLKEQGFWCSNETERIKGKVRV